MVSRYVNGPVKQDGICLIPSHPQHYRMMAPPQRTDGFHVATPPTFVPQQPPNQANNQVPPLRGMPPTGPPTQASTPPNTDLKVQQMSQQPSMNIYVSQAPVRAPTQNFYSRAPPPSSQTPRMANHRQGQQPLYQTQPTQFVPMALQPPMYHLNTSTPVQYFNGGPRPQASYVPSGYQMIPSQTITYQYPQAPTQPQAAYFYSASQLLQRPPPPVATAPQNPTQPPAPAMSLNQPTQQHGSHTKNKRRSRAIPIIDPNTGKDKLSEMYDQEQNDSHPPSGESSARQTPQPPLPNPNKEVQAAFAKQVAQAIGKDEVSAVEELEQPPVLDHMGHSMYQPPPQAVHQRYDTLVQSSKLQAATKEFIPAALSTAKEMTPVVSAITDAVEVTITNKPKDRESPAKGRKQRDPPTQREHKDSVKEVVAVKDAPICEKPVSCSSKDEIKQKDAVVLNVGPNKDAPAAFARDEKKNQKKDKVDIKPSPPSSIAASEDNLPDVGLAIPPPVAPSIPENASCSAKSKHNNGNASQKTKDAPKQPPPPPQQTPPLAPPTQKLVQPVPPVPPTQPSKPTNKTNKQRELNLKGASKEGTDMDAFNDNLVVEDATNANHTTNTSSVNSSDYLNNANNVMLNNNINISSSAVIDDSNKKAESNDVSTTIKPTEIKPLPKGKIDVTDIVKEVPKPMKAIVVPTPVESQDEPDRAALANDKMVQAKNEANAKASAEANDANPETKINLPYKEDQWSPFNKDGKKVYDRDFLLALRKDPKSNKKPENLPADIVANEDRGRIGDISRYAVSGRATDFAPNFGSNSYPNKSSSQRGAPPKRKSQQGSIGGSGKGGKQSVIRVSISVKEDVKLHETENAWKPARFVPSATMTDDENKTADLYKKVRGVLNKLTPQKFETLLDQVRSLRIDTTERLQGVIDLVFEKAVDEPNFSVAYALLCRELALMQVPATDGKRKEGQEFVNFRKLLVTRCQLEFEKNSIDETERNRKTKEIEDCNDPEKRKDMQLDLDEYDRRLRMKSVGNIRFIGELFKQQMLTVNIMLRCLNNLLDTKDEESLECLCKLLTTVGKELESKKVDLGPIFSTMKDIADKKHGRISSRVRFMIQDVIDLRSGRWVPRRQDLNPKTMDQIQKEAEHEQLTIQAMNSVSVTPRREERGGGGGGGVNANTDKKRNNRNVSNDDGWSTAPSRGSRTPFTVQSDKLKNKAPMMDEPLGSIQMFGNWGRGSNIKTQPPLTNTANMYAALENIGTESDKRPALGLRMNNKDTYHSKGPSLERNYRQGFEEGRGSRSGSQHRSRDSSTASQRNMTPAPVPSAPKAQPPTGAPPVPAPIELTPEQLERKLKNILEEYLNDCCSVDECDQDIKISISPSVLPQLVSDGYISVLERSKTARLRTGYLFAQLIKLGTLSLQDYCVGLEAVLEEADELIIDIPRVWDYVAELISPVLCEGSATLTTLHKSFEPLVSKNHASKLLACLFKLIIQEKGPNFLQSSWNSSGFTFANYMAESQVDSYVKENNFEFLLEAGDSSPVSQSHSPLLGQSQLSYEEIHEKLLAFFKSGTSFDDIINWIAANVGDRVKENQFIRTLATACFNDSIVNMKLKADILQGKYNLLHRFVDNKPAYELQCLYALQALINKLEHPQGLLLAICDKLYEENVFSHESFVAWEASKDPVEQEGKGVALKQLTSFFTQLKEADEDSSSSEDA